MISFKEFWTKKTLFGLGLGQFLSLVITSTGFSSTELANRGINAPTSQSFLNYVFLAIIYGGIMLYKKQKLKAKWYYYVVLALVDVEANFLVVKAYQYTSITSVMLLDCWSIPSVMLLTWLFLSTKYRFKKIAGVVVCVAGLVMVVFSDVHSADRSSKFDYVLAVHHSFSWFNAFVLEASDIWAVLSVAVVYMIVVILLLNNLRSHPTLPLAICTYSHLFALVTREFYCHEWPRHLAYCGKNPRKGDALVIAGATLYAISNVSEEFLVKNADRIELMSLLGFFGAIISAIQISILERNELKSIHWSAGAALPFVGFAVAMFLFYSLVPVLLKSNGSTMLNLSLLTSDMWSVVIRIFAYHEKVDWMYFVAFVAVAVGLVIYSGGEKDDEHRADVVEEDAETRKNVDEESCSSSRNRGSIAGSSKTGDNSKDLVTAGTLERRDNENRNTGKDGQGKKS
ncbi:hypothetical protein Tsubulata_045675 [Turnera subulata]|uniref:Uncharacterized protein n=1 Tax=Turnera subulata TaxID=218843 RepID=A0A9Q0FCV6_9ROSI|nr:hypothetical protein Tsubulata_045675 [Turnera subulata]